jgi:hypothetical protein
MNTTSSAFFSRAQAMNARQAWALMAAGVLGYEVVCKDGQLLSECVDEWLVSRPILTRGDSGSGASSWQRSTGTV